MPSLRRDGDVHLLDLGDGENRFTPEWLGELEAALEEVEALEAPRALVTCATGKFLSNGLDLEWLGAHGDEMPAYVARVHGLFARLLGAGVPTVVAVQGHAFAAGAMLVCAHDHVVMREDRGWWCVPEVDIRIPFTEGMNALLAARLPVRTAHEAMTTGRRYAGPEALAAGIVDEVAPEGELLERATAWAQAQAGKDPGTLRTIKQRLHAPALAALREPVAGL
jgi:Delta3-Delta2-enoyl-CoA isomerase